MKNDKLKNYNDIKRKSMSIVYWWQKKKEESELRKKRERKEKDKRKEEDGMGWAPMEGIGVGFLKDFEVVLSTDGDIFMRANFFSCADWVTLCDVMWGRCKTR